MGQSESSFKNTYAETVSQLSSVQLVEISSRFNELYAKAGGAKGLVVDREAFSRYLNLPVAIGDRLFDAFDEKKNGSICFEEFVCGLAIVLHGSFRDRCGLLFRVFNIANDEGISRAELRTMLTAILQSTNTILYTVGETDRAVLGSEDIGETVSNMVDAAFTNCDISRTGKLLPYEFEYWLKRNPKILDSLLVFKTRSEECTLGPLIMSPSEQKLGAAAPSTPTQDTKRSPFFGRKSSRDKVREAKPKPETESDKGQQGSLTPGTQHSERMFRIGSEADSAITPGSRQAGTAGANLLEPEPMFRIGSEAESLHSSSSGQSSLGGDRVQPVATETTPTPSDLAFSSGTLVELERDAGQLGSGQEVLAAGQASGEVLIQIEGVSTAANEPTPSPQVFLQLEQPEGDISISLEPEEGVAQEGVVSEQPDGGEPVPQVGLELDGGTEQDSGMEPDPEMKQDNIDGAGDQADLASSSTTPLNSDQASSEYLASTDATARGGSIMMADSNLSINIAAIPRVESLTTDALGPASPVLPTRQAEQMVFGLTGGPEEKGEGEGGSLGEGGVEEGVEEIEVETQVGGVSVAVEKEKAIIQNTGFGPPDPTPSPSAPPPQPLTVPSPLLPHSGNVSPCMVELEGSEVNETLCQAWVLSKWTRGLLDNPQPGTHLTCPALMTDIKLVDAIQNHLTNHYPDKTRKTLFTVEQVSMDATGLRRLVSSGSLHAALELTGRFLSAHGQGLGQAGQPSIHTHKTLQMWSARVALLMFLRLYKEAELELQAFGEMLNPDLYYQYHTHSYPGKKGSLVPFTLRLLHAILPRHTGKLQLTLDRLCTLQYVCEQILSEIARGKLPDVAEPLSQADQEVAECLWKERLCKVKSSLANALISVQDYGAGMKLYEQVIEDQSAAVRAEVLSGIGRLYLQLGDMSSANSYFKRVQKEVQHLVPPSPLLKMNEGFVNVFLSRWQTARDCFEEALTFDPASKVIQSNITVCNFYMGKLKESIVAMEKLLTSDPPSSLQPPLFANLATAYELESGNSSAKKLSFVPLLAQHIGQGYQHLGMLNIR